MEIGRFGPSVIGQDQYDQEQQNLGTGRFGPSVVKEKEAAPAPEPQAPAPPAEPDVPRETSDPDMTLVAMTGPEVIRSVTANTALLEPVLDAELARQPRARRSVLRGLREVAMAEINDAAVARIDEALG